jgi:hypothetical protein
MLSLGKTSASLKKNSKKISLGENISEPKEEQQKYLFGRSFCCSSSGSLMCFPKEIILLFFFGLADVFPKEIFLLFFFRFADVFPQ